MGELLIRPFAPADLPGVLETLRLALGETPLLRRTPELWNWKHEENPFGRSIVFVASQDGRIAGVRALMRWDLVTTDGEIIRCLRPVDTATHPDFTRRGIFRDLTTVAIEKAKQDGFDLVFNTPNSSSGPGYLKMGWSEVAPIGAMVRPLLRRGPRVDEAGLPDPADYFVGDLDQDVQDIIDRPPRGLRTPRSPRYLRWRFSGHPTARYLKINMGAQTVILRPNLRGGRKEVLVSDLIGDRPAAGVRAAARRSRAVYLGGWFSPASPERRAALTAGLIPVPGARALTLMALPLRTLPVDVHSIQQWDIALGDLELL